MTGQGENRLPAEGDAQVLLAVYHAQKTESLQHRQNIFNAFAGWSMMLLVATGAMVGLESPSLLNADWKKLVAKLVSVAMSLAVIAFMWLQRREANRGLNITKKLERHWKLFQKDERFAGTSVLPPDWERDRHEWRCSCADGIQVFVVVGLTAILWWVLR